MTLKKKASKKTSGKPAKSPSKAAKAPAKVSKKAAAITGTRPSRIAKHVKKLEKLKSGSVSASDISFRVRVVALNSPCDLAGVIVDDSNGALVVHHQKHGSSKELVTVIPRSDLIEVIGGMGVPSVIRYFGERVLTEIKSAQVESDGDTFHITDLTTGDLSTAYASSRTRVEISGDAVVSEKKAKAGKPAKKFK